jgi:hypothetical protein
MVGRHRLKSSDPRRLLGHIAPGMFLVALGAGVLWWIYEMGGFVAGESNLPFLAPFIWLPLVACWYSLGVIWVGKMGKKWYVAFLAALTLLSYPIYKQPWNPRSIFVSKLGNLTGKSLTQVQSEMKAYLPSGLSVAEEQYVPEEIWVKGVTHQTSYRWNETDGRYNAEIGQVFVRDGIVVGTKFLPD